MYLLYDTALNGLFTQHLLQQAYPINCSLFKGTPDEHLFDVAPYVFKIDNLLIQKINHTETSLNQSIVVESAQSLTGLYEHFKSYFYTKINGKQHFFRFWDARVLSRFLLQSTTEQHNSFFSEVDCFCIPNFEKEDFTKYYLHRGKLQTQVLPFNVLFEIPANAAIISENENVVFKEEKTRRTFFK